MNQNQQEQAVVKASGENNHNNGNDNNANAYFGGTRWKVGRIRELIRFVVTRPHLLKPILKFMEDEWYAELYAQEEEDDEIQDEENLPAGG